MPTQEAPPSRRDLTIRFRDVTYDLTTLSRDDLLALKVAIDEGLHGVRTQLEVARAQVRERGVYSDRSWYTKAQSALRHYQTASQRVQLALRQQRQADKAAGQERRLGQPTFPDCFYQVAQEHLPAPVFAALKEAATQRYVERAAYAARA